MDLKYIIFYSILAIFLASFIFDMAISYNNFKNNPEKFQDEENQNLINYFSSGKVIFNPYNFAHIALAGFGLLSVYATKKNKGFLPVMVILSIGMVLSSLLHIEGGISWL